MKTTEDSGPERAPMYGRKGRALRSASTRERMMISLRHLRPIRIWLAFPIADRHVRGLWRVHQELRLAFILRLFPRVVRRGHPGTFLPEQVVNLLKRFHGRATHISVHDMIGRAARGEIWKCRNRGSFVFAARLY